MKKPKRRSRELQVWLDVEMRHLPPPMKRGGDLEVTLRGRYRPDSLDQVLSADLYPFLVEKLRDAQAAADAKVEIQEREREERERQQREKGPVCWFWKQGRCKFGADCPMQHRLLGDPPGAEEDE